MNPFRLISEVYRKVTGAIDSIIAPIYRILFVGYALSYVIGYYVSPYLISAYNWVDLQIADIGPVISATPRARILIASGFAFVGVIAGLIRRHIRIQRRLRAILEEIGRCISRHLDYYDKIFTTHTDGTLQQEAKLSLISKDSREHSVFLCSRIAEMFEMMTGHPCHASIKTLDRATGMVTTRTRDALMHNQARVIADEQLRSYPFRENSAFLKILNDDDCDFFMSNWLKTQAFANNYQNSNPNWRKHYSATVVVPISSNRNPTELNPATVIGFICVDNKRGGFSERYCRALLAPFVPFFNDMMVKLGEMELP